VPDARPERTALLAEVAGLQTGYHEGGPGEPRARAAAYFLFEAGPDEDLIGRWGKEGRRRNKVAVLTGDRGQGKAPPPGERWLLTCDRQCRP